MPWTNCYRHILPSARRSSIWFPGESISLVGFSCSSCTLASSHSSKRSDHRCLCNCLPLNVSHVMNLWRFQGISRLSPTVSWDRLWSVAIMDWWLIYWFFGLRLNPQCCHNNNSLEATTFLRKCWTWGRLALCSTTEIALAGQQKLSCLWIEKCRVNKENWRIIKDLSLSIGTKCEIHLLL